MEVSPTYFVASPNDEFSLNCTAKAEIDGKSMDEWGNPFTITIEWTVGLMNETLMVCNSTEPFKSCVMYAVGSDAVNDITYRCTAKYSSFSNFSDASVLLEGKCFIH